MSEWTEITCREREDLYWHGFDALPKPIASSTDPERYIYTEWGHPDTDKPVLRDHRWPDGSQPCRHEVPVVEVRRAFEEVNLLTTEAWLDDHGVRSSAIGSTT